MASLKNLIKNIKLKDRTILLAYERRIEIKYSILREKGMEKSMPIMIILQSKNKMQKIMEISLSQV